MKVISFFHVILTASLLLPRNITAKTQSAQQTEDATKTTASRSKQSGKNSQDGAATAKKDTSNNSASATTPSSSAPATTQSGPAANAPASKPNPAPKTSPAKNSGMVWVNTESGVYHKRGTRWYGRTKQGKYMLEADAIKAGYKASNRN